MKTEGFTWRIEHRGDTAALRLDRQPGKEWAHLYLQPEERSWDFSDYEYLVLEVTNLGGGRVACAWQVENEGFGKTKGFGGQS